MNWEQNTGNKTIIKLVGGGSEIVSVDVISIDDALPNDIKV